MPTNNVARLRASISSELLRVGPHEDIADCCEFETEIDDDWDPTTAVTICDLVKASLIADSTEQRVKAAKATLEQSDDRCGIAWLVLGREGAPGPEEAEQFLEKAVELLKQESDSEELTFGHLVEEDAYALAVADLAQSKWNTGKREEAVELITSCFEESRDNVWGDIRTTLRDLAVSFLIQCGKAQQAQILLFSDTEDSAEWHYLNALVHFSLSGDCLISRSALALSMMTGTMTADRLLNGDTSIFQPTVDAFGLRRYIADTEPAWQRTAGAIDWLASIFADPYVRHNREMVEVSVHNGDRPRWKRWEDTFERADHKLMQGNANEGKKLHKSALREAERIDYSSGPFHLTMTALLDLAEQTGESFDELRSRIEIRAARLCSDSSAVEPIHALHSQSFGTLFQYMDDYETAARYHENAMREIDHHISEACPILTLIDAEEARFYLACSLFELERYSDAIPVLSREIELLESYLGQKHVRLLEPLSLTYQCMSHIGDEERARSLRERILSIDELYFDDVPTPSGAVCDSCGMEHD